MEKKEEVALWAFSAKALLKYFKSSHRGLTSKEAKKRLDEYGYNDISKKEGHSWFQVLFEQFTDPLIIVLIVAAFISYFLDQQMDSLVIITIVLISAFLAFFQEYKADRAVRELRKYITLKAKIIRNDEVMEVDSKELVPGDIVLLHMGDVIPADIRLLDALDMTTDESALTGESLPVIKKVMAVSKEHSLPQYLKNIAFMSTSVVSGTGKGIVIATGENTFFGRTASYLRQDHLEGGFKKGVSDFSNFLLKVILIMTLFIFIANSFLGKGILTSLLFALAVAVGITPEVLPIIMTISMSNGALHLAKQKVVVKKLSSVEDLGNMDVLCCDKTGTLTEGRLNMYDFINIDGKREQNILLYGALCAETKGILTLIDKAIHDYKHTISHLLHRYTLLHTNDFDFERRRMSVVVEKDKQKFLIAKGAPESIIRHCHSVKFNNQVIAMNPNIHKKITKLLANYSQQGYISIAVAEKPIAKKKYDKQDESQMILVGFLLFSDPPKHSSKKSIELLQDLSVDIKVISGDDPIITRKICNEVGLGIIKNRVIVGTELENISPEKLDEFTAKYNVFARITPVQKFQIVQSLSRQNHTVGFLGDGINDAPALKLAHVGISVESGTGIAKEAADIILLKKGLNVIADGVHGGRQVFGNTIKYIMNTISANFGNMFTVALSSLYLNFIPMLP